jgi:hypothetical protein
VRRLHQAAQHAREPCNPPPHPLGPRQALGTLSQAPTATKYAATYTYLAGALGRYVPPPASRFPRLPWVPAACQSARPTKQGRPTKGQHLHPTGDTRRTSYLPACLASGSAAARRWRQQGATHAPAISPAQLQYAALIYILRALEPQTVASPVPFPLLDHLLPTCRPAGPWIISV